MSFAQSFPTVAQLLGNRNVSLLDHHAAELMGKPDDDAEDHFETCTLADWCALNTTPEYRDNLDLIEWGLHTVASVLPPQKFQSSYSQKAQNRDQFNQFLAEIATAATCAVRAKLLDLEWSTGKRNYDADVRAEICNEPVNLEVTLRTDSWLQDTAVHMEDIFDIDGNQIAEIPAAKSRRMMTERERDDLAETGIVLPTRVSDVIADRRQTPRQMVFVSDINELPPVEEKGAAYCADGDNPNVESNSIRRCIQEKASKFNADGNHFVVLATMQPGFPSEQSVFDCVFGQAPQLRHYGIFESELYNQICGVLYVPVMQQLHRIRNPNKGEALARLFVNHNATLKASEPLIVELARVFDAQIRRGHVDRQEI